MADYSDQRRCSFHFQRGKGTTASVSCHFAEDLKRMSSREERKIERTCLCRPCGFICALG